MASFSTESTTIPATTTTTPLLITITATAPSLSSPAKQPFATSPFSASSSPAVLLSTIPHSPSPSSPPPPISLPSNSLSPFSAASLPELHSSQSTNTVTPPSPSQSLSPPSTDAASSSDPKQIVFVAETLLPTRKGAYRLQAYRDMRKSCSRSEEIIVLVWGDVNGQKEVPIRVHDQCFTSEVLGSLKCDCREQLESAMDYIRDNERGLGCIIYLSQEGRGIGLLNKIRAYALQEAGYDTVDANTALGFADDLREYSCVPVLLNHLQIQSVRLLTNNPRKMTLLQQLGVQVVDRIPIVIAPNPVNDYYHQTKKAKMGHWI